MNGVEFDIFSLEKMRIIAPFCVLFLNISWAQAINLPLSYTAIKGDMAYMVQKLSYEGLIFGHLISIQNHHSFARYICYERSLLLKGIKGRQYDNLCTI